MAVVTEITARATSRATASAGELVARRALPAHVRAGWAPSLDDAATIALTWARPGDLVITFGVGEPWKLARAIVEGLTRA